jgi:hypothetical protein
MLRLPGALAGGVFALIAVVCLSTPSDIGFTAPQPAPASIRQSVLIDQQTLIVESAPGEGNPQIDQTRAMMLAVAYLPGSAHPSGVQSRYVVLTLRDASGSVAGAVSSQPAWLITFPGAAYIPSSTSASVCSCPAIYQRPNTVVAIDARTGALIALLGTDN